MRRAPCGYTVPMYADGCELLVFRTFSQSVSASKRVFRHAGREPTLGSAPFLCYYGPKKYDATPVDGGVHCAAVSNEGALRKLPPAGLGKPALRMERKRRLRVIDHRPYGVERQRFRSLRLILCPKRRFVERVFCKAGQCGDLLHGVLAGKSLCNSFADQLQRVILRQRPFLSRRGTRND